VNVTFPEEYAEELAGKDAVFKVTVKGIKEKQLPELDDEFAKDVSEFDTLDELRADIRKTLEESREKSAKSAFENEIYNKLANLVTDEIPECMIEKAIDNMITEFRYNIESQGIPYEQYLSYFGMTADSMKENYRERAEKDVKIELALAFRLAIYRYFGQRMGIMVLDEPTAHLSPAGIEYFGNLLQTVSTLARNMNLQIIMPTHEKEIMQFMDSEIHFD
jgi:ABC-type ATPase with predicted acetyltransferase domain